MSTLRSREQFREVTSTIEDPIVRAGVIMGMGIVVLSEIPHHKVDGTEVPARPAEPPVDTLYFARVFAARFSRQATLQRVFSGVDLDMLYTAPATGIEDAQADQRG